MALDDRGAQVLRLVVEDYIETAEPVGSRTISKRMSQALSPATIRNIMADLEEVGYLCQPHTSAGRIPTGTGFRYYVNYLLARQQLARSDRDLLHQVGETEVAGADDVVRNATRLLSILSRHACVVVVSRFSHQAIRSISLLRAASDKILLVAVLQGGWVQHRLIEDEPGLTTDELEKINAYLNDMAVELTLPQLRVKIMNEMRREKARYDSLMRRALLLGSKAIADSLPGEVYIEGRTNILEQPEFVEDFQKLKRILHAFEEKGTILRLLDSALESDAIQVSIGAENPVEELPEISVVSSGYHQGEYAMGSIGLIGPVRMDYSRVIPLVEYTARLLSSILEHR